MIWFREEHELPMPVSVRAGLTFVALLAGLPLLVRVIGGVFITI